MDFADSVQRRVRRSALPRLHSCKLPFFANSGDFLRDLCGQMLLEHLTAKHAEKICPQSREKSRSLHLCSRMRFSSCSSTTNQSDPATAGRFLWCRFVCTFFAVTHAGQDLELARSRRCLSNFRGASFS